MQTETPSILLRVYLISGDGVLVADGWPGVPVLLFLFDVLFTAVSSFALYLFINLCLDVDLSFFVHISFLVD